MKSMTRPLAALLRDRGEASLQRHSHLLKPVTVGLMAGKHWCRWDGIILDNTKGIPPFHDIFVYRGRTMGVQVGDFHVWDASRWCCSGCMFLMAPFHLAKKETTWNKCRVKELPLCPNSV